MIDRRFIHAAINVRGLGYRAQIIRPTSWFPRGGVRAWSRWYGYLGALYWCEGRLTLTCNFWARLAQHWRWEDEQ